MRRLAALAAAALVAAGCGTAEHDRAVARAQSWAKAHGLAGNVTCNSGLHPPAALSASSDFICLVHHTPDDCTVLHVTPRAKSIAIRLLRRHGACAEPL